MSGKAKKKVDLALLATQLLRARDAGKEAYGRADQLLEELLQHAQPGDQISIGGGQVVELVDQFADRSVVWKPAGVRRFDVKVRRAADLTSKL